MRIAGLSMVAASVLVAACTTTPSARAADRQASEAATLAQYEAAAGAPVRSISIFGSPRWDSVDGSHIL